MTLKADQLKNYRKSILEFIEYLYENRGYMKDDVKTIEKCREIGNRQFLELKPRENYKDARKFNELQSEKEELYHNLTWNNLIYSKAKELKLYENLTIEIRNRLNTAIHLMYDIKPAEATEIIKAKEKYLTFRKETDFCSFLIELFYDLDLALTEFFGAFTDVSDMKRTQSEPPTPQPEADPVETIINNFNGDSVDDIIDHFRSLEKLMNNGEFMQWIKLAFEKQEPPERKFQLKRGFKIGKIRGGLFYTYYKKPGNHGEKDKYVKLLSDYFEGFEFENTKANFNK